VHLHKIDKPVTIARRRTFAIEGVDHLGEVACYALARRSFTSFSSRWMVKLYLLVI
jgi:hypothetical protein